MREYTSQERRAIIARALTAASESRLRRADYWSTAARCAVLESEVGHAATFYHRAAKAANTPTEAERFRRMAGYLEQQ